MQRLQKFFPHYQSPALSLRLFWEGLVPAETPCADLSGRLYKVPTLTRRAVNQWFDNKEGFLAKVKTYVTVHAELSGTDQ